jgi:UDP-2,3-diacylglucosamine pyrophosphatase LpxH
MKRSLDISVISDAHLGTYGCHAEELLGYLRSIKPRILIINGDFIDGWQFRKKFFPKTHLEVIHEVIQMAIQGVKVYYITGNHDEFLRKFSDVDTGPIHLKDSLILQLQNEKYWFFHGDVFDASVMLSPWLAKLGGFGYDYLIRLNRYVNHIRARLGMKRVSFSHAVKRSVKHAVRYISDFEKLAVQHAHKKGCDYVICGHIHRPIIAKHKVQDGRDVTYMNSGDWIENLTALELREGQWRIFSYETSDLRRDYKSNSTQANQVTVPLRDTLRKKIFNPGDILQIWF